MSHVAHLAEAAADDSVEVDQALASAVELAREAAIVESGTSVFIGDHIGVIMEADRLATHLFTCTNPAYLGWQWAVTMFKTDAKTGSKTAAKTAAKSATKAGTAKNFTITITDVVLLPGPQALTAPAWVPWSERLQPGDLSPGDVLPSAPDDPRLTAGFADFQANEIDEDFHYVEEYRGVLSGWELGLGRARVLSVTGRDQSADRWIEGECGPETAMARQSPGPCSTCGFHVALAGPLGQAFAVCSNEISPADGRVVSLSFGCGAHSGVIDPGFTPVERAGSTSIE